MPQKGRKCILLYIYPTKESYPDRDLLQISKMKGNPEEKKKKIRNLNRHFTKDSNMNNKHMKGC